MCQEDKVIVIELTEEDEDWLRILRREKEALAKEKEELREDQKDLREAEERLREDRKD